jgi:hypothetical protein
MVIEPLKHIPGPGDPDAKGTIPFVQFSGGP